MKSNENETLINIPSVLLGYILVNYKPGLISKDFSIKKWKNQSFKKTKKKKEKNRMKI